MGKGAANRVRNRLLQLPAKLAGEVGDIDESDPGAAPQMVVDLGDRGDARRCVLEGLPNLLRLGAGLCTRSSPTTDARLFLTRWLISRVSMA
jgi:hypothetical protein